jgi:hypothetical protein
VLTPEQQYRRNMLAIAALLGVGVLTFALFSGLVALLLWAASCPRGGC